jgi:hypothetical protein
MNVPAVLAAARRSQAAYLPDPRAAFRALGLTVAGRYENADHQAVLSHDAAGAAYLSISGTRFGAQGGLADTMDDICHEPLDLGGGALVTAGAYAGLDAMWAWAESVAPGAVFTVDGHSLGGWRARYTGRFLPAERIAAIYSFESPKGGNAAFWASQAPTLSKLTSVVNGRDVFVGWPFVGAWEHPDHDTLWLTGGSARVIRPRDWPGPLLFTDHSIDRVVARLAALRP